MCNVDNMWMLLDEDSIMLLDEGSMCIMLIICECYWMKVP